MTRKVTAADAAATIAMLDGQRAKSRTELRLEEQASLASTLEASLQKYASTEASGVPAVINADGTPTDATIEMLTGKRPSPKARATSAPTPRITAAVVTAAIKDNVARAKAASKAKPAAKAKPAKVAKVPARTTCVHRNNEGAYDCNKARNRSASGKESGRMCTAHEAAWRVDAKARYAAAHPATAKAPTAKVAKVAKAAKAKPAPAPRKPATTARSMGSGPVTRVPAPQMGGAFLQLVAQDQ